ncbi:MAG: DUF192 domain-containing protein [Desulfomonile tiedjei]|nr:DUF192 domain-containing protein [Desulfomonile tiedjei]
MTISLLRPEHAILLVIILALSFGVAAADDTQRTGNSNVSGPKLHTISISLNRVTIRAVVADSDATRRQGLLGWDKITDDLGMLLDFAVPGQYAIHMQGMKFPIDAIWIDSDGTIKLVYEEIPANSGQIYPSMFPCRYCLEVNAGFCKRNQIKAGQKVRFGFPE